VNLRELGQCNARHRRRLVLSLLQKLLVVVILADVALLSQNKDLVQCRMAVEVHFENVESALYTLGCGRSSREQKADMRAGPPLLSLMISVETGAKFLLPCGVASYGLASISTMPFLGCLYAH
jgi:hypothetical protein